MNKIKVAIIGSGNIGTDLMIKVMRTAKHLEMGVFVGIDPNSDGLARAERMGVSTTHEGIDGLLNHPLWPEIGFVFDATSAKAHVYNYDKIKAFEGKRVIDLTPAAIGPFMVPPEFKEPPAKESVHVLMHQPRKPRQLAQQRRHRPRLRGGGDPAAHPIGRRARGCLHQHAAIAGAPVTEWRLYDTFYTERYLGHPDTDAAAYDASNPATISKVFTAVVSNF